MQQITAWQYLKDVLKYRFTRKKYINKFYIIKGKKRKIIGEDCYNVWFEGITESIPKAYLQTLQQPKINPYKNKAYRLTQKALLSHLSQN